MRVKETVHTDIFAENRQVYQRLKLALSLNLRRQIFFAVCDDLQLRRHIVTRLNSTLAYPAEQELGQSASTGESVTTAYPKLVTLRLNLSDPNPLAQINQWLANYPPPVIVGSSENPGRSLSIPSFQIVGVELLTKQPVAVQRLFLHYLRLSEHYFSTQTSAPFLESTLLLWLQRPWLHAIQQSAAKFWYCRTGTFIFAGEPKPTIESQSYPEKSSKLPNLNLVNLEPSNQDALNNAEQVDAAVIQNVTATENADSVIELEQNPENQSQSSTVISPGQSVPLTLLSSDHVNQELSQLIKATTNPQDPDDYWRATQLFSKIEELASQQVSRSELALAYQDLGNLYRLRIEQGHASLENLMVAIIAYQEAITHDDNLPDLIDVLHDLGTLYWLLHRTPGSPESERAYIEQGIEFYQLVINLILPETHAETYTNVQNNLGTAYGDLARLSQPVENWQKAIAAYQEAIHYQIRENEPLKYAACQNNLGTAYWHLGQHIQPIENLRLAIAAYNQALIYYTPEDSPIKHGMVQNNIGTAYWNLAQQEKPWENLELAIKFYEEALIYRTKSEIPNAYAATKNNIGTVYWHMANLSENTREYRQELLNLCISAFKEAINIDISFKEISLNFDIIGTYNNLGLAYYQLVIDGYLNGDKKSIAANLKSSLINHLQALKELQDQPESYKTTLNHIIKIVRTFYDELGIQGQNLALSQIPSQLIPEVLSRL